MAFLVFSSNCFDTVLLASQGSVIDDVGDIATRMVALLSAAKWLARLESPFVPTHISSESWTSSHAPPDCSCPLHCCTIPRLTTAAPFTNTSASRSGSKSGRAAKCRQIAPVLLMCVITSHLLMSQPHLRYQHQETVCKRRHAAQRRHVASMSLGLLHLTTRYQKHSQWS